MIVVVFTYAFVSAQTLRWQAKEAQQAYLSRLYPRRLLARCVPPGQTARLSGVPSVAGRLLVGL